MARIVLTDLGKQLIEFRRKFPKIAGKEAEIFFKERFVRKNWLDQVAQPWKRNATPPDWVPKQWRKRGGSILVGKGSGRLKRSIRTLRTTKNSVTVGTDVPYAQIHNEGGTIHQTLNIKPHTRKRQGRAHSVKAHTRKRTIKIPKRQFIGKSAMLEHRITRVLQVELFKILRQ